MNGVTAEAPQNGDWCFVEQRQRFIVPAAYAFDVQALREHLQQIHENGLRAVQTERELGMNNTRNALLAQSEGFRQVCIAYESEAKEVTRTELEQQEASLRTQYMEYVVQAYNDANKHQAAVYAELRNSVNAWLSTQSELADAHVKSSKAEAEQNLLLLKQKACQEVTNLQMELQSSSAALQESRRESSECNDRLAAAVGKLEHQQAEQDHLRNTLEKCEQSVSVGQTYYRQVSAELSEATAAAESQIHELVTYRRELESERVDKSCGHL